MSDTHGPVRALVERALANHLVRDRVDRYTGLAYVRAAADARDKEHRVLQSSYASNLHAYGQAVVEAEAAAPAWPTGDVAAEQLARAIRRVLVDSEFSKTYHELRYHHDDGIPFAAAVLARLAAGEGDTQP
jgi:hypothetical protein